MVGEFINLQEPGKKLEIDSLTRIDEAAAETAQIPEPNPPLHFPSIIDFVPVLGSLRYWPKRDWETLIHNFLCCILLLPPSKALTTMHIPTKRRIAWTKIVMSLMPHLTLIYTACTFFLISPSMSSCPGRSLSNLSGGVATLSCIITCYKM